MNTSRLVEKLQAFVRLSEADKAELARICGANVQKFEARADIVSEGVTPGVISLLLEGFACRHRTLEDGRRQIIGLVLPGDVCDSRMFVVRTMDHTIETLAPSTVARIDKDDLLEMMTRAPRLARAFWWSDLVDESLAREWIVSIGQRSAYERMAHLFCEIMVRSRTAGLVADQSCAFPLTQQELGEALGITTVHVSRTLKTLRADGLITLKGGRLTVHDLGRLMESALFNTNYLHLEHDGRDFDANE